MKCRVVSQELQSVVITLSIAAVALGTACTGWALTNITAESAAEVLYSDAATATVVTPVRGEDLGKALEAEPDEAMDEDSEPQAAGPLHAVTRSRLRSPSKPKDAGSPSITPGAANGSKTAPVGDGLLGLDDPQAGEHPALRVPTSAPAPATGTVAP